MNNNSVFYSIQKENQNNKINKKEKGKEENNKTIYKIVKSSFYILNELTNVKKIRQYKTHFYTCEDSSILDISEITDDTEDIDETQKKPDETILLQFQPKQLISFKNYLKKNMKPQKFIFSLITFYRDILKSLLVLKENNIIHNFVNVDSIVIDKRNQVLLTDFKFSIDSKQFTKNVSSFIRAYEPSYIEWSPEFHILSYMITNKLHSLSFFNIETIVNDIIAQNYVLNAFDDKFVSLYKTESLQYFAKYVNKSYEFIVNDVLTYCYTWDNYSLGILFLKILINIHKCVKVKNKFIILFMKLLVNNIHLNPLKRPTIEIALNNFEDFLNSTSQQDYKDCVNLLV